MENNSVLTLSVEFDYLTFYKEQTKSVEGKPSYSLNFISKHSLKKRKSNVSSKIVHPVTPRLMELLERKSVISFRYSEETGSSVSSFMKEWVNFINNS